MSVPQIMKIAIIGSGKLGSDIFYNLMDLDFQLLLICIDKEESEKQNLLFQKRINRQLKSGFIDDPHLKYLQEAVTIDYGYEKLADCDLIIECIWEDKLQKKKLFEEIAPFINNNCIVTSNSSSINPSLLNPSEAFNQRFFGLHFFYPLRLKNIVEIIKTDFTTDDNLNILTDFCNKIGKTFLLLDEANSFILNKLFLEVQNKAYNIFLEGNLDMKEIDTMVSDNLFPGGIFSFLDQVGIDIMLESVKNYIPVSKRIPYQDLIERLESMIADNYLGVKTNMGFYDYLNPDRDKIDWVEPFTGYYPDTIKRLTLAYIAKAQSIVDDGICSRDLLEFAAKEYMNADKGPFAIMTEYQIENK